MCPDEAKDQVLNEEQALEYLRWKIANVRRGVEQLADDNLWRVADGSPMAADDQRTNPYQISHVSRSLIGSAVDHLHAVGNLVERAEVLHPMAQFTLARGAIETASAAAWMLAPAARAERLTRRLRLAVKDSSDSYQVSDGTAIPRQRTKAEQLARFTELAAQAGLNADAIRKHPTSTEMVSAAAGSFNSAFSIVVAWRLCSGFAHGRTWAAMSALDRVAVVEDPKSGVGLYRVTSTFAHVGWAVAAGLEITQHAAVLYQRRATSFV